MTTSTELSRRARARRPEHYRQKNREVNRRWRAANPERVAEIRKAEYWRHVGKRRADARERRQLYYHGRKALVAVMLIRIMFQMSNAKRFQRKPTMSRPTGKAFNAPKPDTTDLFIGHVDIPGKAEKEQERRQLQEAMERFKQRGGTIRQLPEIPTPDRTAINGHRDHTYLIVW